jgi:hypothetical protein
MILMAGNPLTLTLSPNGGEGMDREFAWSGQTTLPAARQ